MPRIKKFCYKVVKICSSSQFLNKNRYNRRNISILFQENGAFIMTEQLRQAALDFHEFPIPGKIEVTPTKSLATQRDLALAYSPGVAEPCLEIEKILPPLTNIQHVAI